MADLGDIASLVGGTATGGLLGLGGALAQKVAGYYIDKQKAKDDLAARQAEYAHALDMARLGQSADAAKAQADLMLAKLSGEVASLQASIADNTALMGRVSPWVADVNGLARPGLTLLLVLAAMLTALAVTLGATDALLNPFYQFSSMASMAVAWWFGSRDGGRVKA